MFTAIVGCNDESMLADLTDEHRKIYLAAALENKESTRAPYELSSPTSLKPLDVEVWASTEKYKYPNSGANGAEDNGQVAIHTTARFQSSAPQLLNTAIYNSIAKPTVYFVALYPQGWTAVDNTNAKFSINGAQDVLFASQIQGAYATEYEKTPLLHFKHLLTWLSFEIKADDENAANAWGKVKQITIKSKKDVKIDLSSASYTESTSDNGTVYNYKSSGYTFETDTTLPVYHKNPASDHLTADTTFGAKHNKNGGYELDTTPREIAYAICCPVDASYTDIYDNTTAEYTLYITTENRSAEVPIDLKKSAGSEANNYFVGSTMGRKFTIQLNFKLGNTIAVAAKMKEWESGGIINENITE